MEIKNIFFKYLPDVFYLINNHICWSEIEEKFQKKMSDREKLLKFNLEVKDESNLIDILIMALQKDKNKESFVYILNATVRTLLTTLDLDRHKGIREILIDKIFNFSGHHFLNACGELFILDLLLKSSFKLQCIEFKLTNGKKIDFKVLNTQNDAETLIEILNIHINVDKLPISNNLFEDFIKNRIVKKIETKALGLEVINNEMNFTIVPIIWCTDVVRLIPFDSFFEKFPIVYKKHHIFEPLILIQRPYFNGDFGFEFGTVSETIKKFEADY